MSDDAFISGILSNTARMVIQGITKFGGAPHEDLSGFLIRVGAMANACNAMTATEASSFLPA